MAEKKKDHWGFLADILGTKSSRKKANEEAIEEVTDAVIEEVEATSAETTPETVDAVADEAEIEVADTEVNTDEMTPAAEAQEVAEAGQDNSSMPPAADEPILMPIEEETSSSWDVLANQLGVASSQAAKKPNPVSDWVGQSTGGKAAETIDTVRVFGEPEERPEDKVEARQKEVLSEMFVPQQESSPNVLETSAEDDQNSDSDSVAEQDDFEETKDTTWLAESLDEDEVVSVSDEEPLDDDEAMVEVEQLDGNDDRPERRRR
ncbi:MAG: hypothetical protein VXZ53_01025, partial [Planctomycetota bacterium]|nr:hypothetical protein [Planctomycetota bacterium]